MSFNTSKILFFFFFLKLKEDHDSIRESHTKLEIQVKTSEMELENHAKRTAQLEGEIKGKVCNLQSQTKELRHQASSPLLPLSVLIIR